MKIMEKRNKLCRTTTQILKNNTNSVQQQLKTIKVRTAERNWEVSLYYQKN